MTLKREVQSSPIVDDRVVETVSGRIARKFSLYPHFYFIDITWSGMPEGALFPVIVKDTVCPVDSYPRLHPGDVVRVTGKVESHASEVCANRCFEATCIEIVERWDTERYGIFGFQGFQQKSEKCNTIDMPVSSRRIVCAVQCQLDVIERVEAYLKLTFGEFHISKSSSPITLSRDRLILLWSDCVDTDSNAVAQRVLADPVLMYALRRVYTIPRSAVSGITIDECIEKCIAYLSTPTSPMSVRIHAFPRFVPVDPIGGLFSQTAVSFDPRTYTHALTLVYAEGVFFAAIAAKEDVVGCGLHLSQDLNPCLAVSKAAAKILEAITLLDRFPETRDRADLRGKQAIDVGASPGGWSYYLSLERGCKNVIAVDMGALAAPIPAGVDHWKMKGQTVIAQLLGDKAEGSLHCYACDMNCELTDTVALFLTAVPLMAPQSVAVLTFKRTIRNKERWAALRAEGHALLKTCDRIDFAHEIHLIANTPNETTVLIGLR